MNGEQAKVELDRLTAIKHEKTLLVDDVESKLFKLMESLKNATEAGLEVEIKTRRFDLIFNKDYPADFEYEIIFKAILRNSTGQ
ncbi:hypothetical protein VB796_06740 [Arcicella sp. LKC2W]|uniref:hypothetical protein n=1 Tax=Arcicella sp. LKC2W TaxID=2984198 RepID=UPI002B220EF4|nr:hypothetical protein [Arcicella sp. LKC2W]MEA5458724.1 hypothetical protein [Arcicella sp. LKC2W]